jgi:hypothetical protein
VDVLQETGEGGLLEGLLKIFVSSATRNSSRVGEDGRSVPPDELVEDLDVLFQVIYLGRLLGVEYGERGDGCAVIDVATAGLDKTADKDNLEEGICVFEEFEGRACLDELGCKRIKVALWDGFEMLVELVPKDCGKLRKRGNN